MGLFRRSSDQPLYGLKFKSPNEPDPVVSLALQYQEPTGGWRPPRNRKEALWVAENNVALVDPTDWTAELIEFKPSWRHRFTPKSVKQQYPQLVWSEEDQQYIDPTKIAPEAAGFTQEEADAGFKHEASDEPSTV